MPSTQRSATYSKGLVLKNSAVSYTSNGGLQINSIDQDDSELRRAVLFWDKLARVSNNIVYMAPTPDEMYLKSVGVLQEIRGESYLEGVGGAVHHDAQFNAFEKLERMEPGQWALSGSDGLYLMRHQADQTGSSGGMRLYAAIPVPSSITPLEDLLNFKTRNEVALKDLQLALDGIWSTVVGAENPAHALKQAIGTIDRSCAEVIRAAKRSRIQFSISDTEVYAGLDYSLSGSALGASAGSLAQFVSQYFGTNGIELPAVGAVLGAAASGIKAGVKAGVKLRWRGTDPSLQNSPYRYVSALNSRPL